MTSATFRFYEELNDFLPAERRRQSFTCECARGATVKHMIEALGIPHTEVEMVLLNGESVGFERVIFDGDRLGCIPSSKRWTSVRCSRFVRNLYGCCASSLMRTLVDWPVCCA